MYVETLDDRVFNLETLNSRPGLPGAPGTVPLASGRAPAPFWFLSLGWLAPGGTGVGTAGPGTAGPGAAGAMGATGVTCSTCERRVEGMSASLSLLAGGNKDFHKSSQTRLYQK